jgi:hypothetical protein
MRASRPSAAAVAAARAAAATGGKERPPSPPPPPLHTQRSAARYCFCSAEHCVRQRTPIDIMQIVKPKTGPCVVLPGCKHVLHVGCIACPSCEARLATQLSKMQMAQVGGDEEEEGEAKEEQVNIEVTDNELYPANPDEVGVPFALGDGDVAVKIEWVSPHAQRAFDMPASLLRRTSVAVVPAGAWTS